MHGNVPVERHRLVERVAAPVDVAANHKVGGRNVVLLEEGVEDGRLGRVGSVVKADLGTRTFGGR